ncbi:MAG TPA: glycosyltransferase family 39 protein [Anaerolineae bacterium]|nr:glycosyltransferase family 39 protein [Anaerolineae bacterium]
MLRTHSIESQVTTRSSQRLTAARVLPVLTGLALIGLALLNLTLYPRPWFDEGSHLHVPKTLVTYGVYADYSSEGFRYFGPSIGIGPTVMLPIAASFKVFGIGLLQARLVMVAYLLVAVFACFVLARRLGGSRLAWFAVLILAGSQAIGLLETGRQVLGEVPALAFLALGWAVWLAAETRLTARPLVLAGALFGLSAITKNQTALLLLPTLFVAWLANLVYYRRQPQRYFLIPLTVAVAVYGVWQLIVMAFLGSGTLSENLALLRQFTSGAALVFSPNLMIRSVNLLLGQDTLAGWIVPVVIYGVFVGLRRTADGQRWGNVMIFVLGGLAWYVFASISWLRYAFMPLALVTFVAAKLLDQLLSYAAPQARAWWSDCRRGETRAALAPVVLAVFVMMSLLPLSLTARHILKPPSPDVQYVAEYLNANIARDALIETWEPELGFLTNHRYHFPQQALLDTSVRHIWLSGPSPASQYNFQTYSPEYVIVGEFAKYVGLYSPDELANDYHLIESFGAYDVYAHNGLSAAPASSP